LAEPKLQEMQSDDFFQKPVKITCSWQYGPAFEPDFSFQRSSPGFGNFERYHLKITTKEIGVHCQRRWVKWEKKD
jgi:hypothetical protein